MSLTKHLLIIIFILTHAHTPPPHPIPEDEGRDLNCVVSSLAQLMVDPYFRSISGFETLIQKEWVAMGHPFTTRHGLILDSLTYSSEEQLLEVSPGFCVLLWW